VAATAEEVAGLARSVFGWETLRTGQLDAVRALVDGRDVLAVMPTGYGKSAIYQLAGLLRPGPTVVVSPLIALQADQVAAISDHEDAPQARAVNSARGARRNAETWRTVATHDTEYLFLAPEQAVTEDATRRLAGAGVGLLVVDEAHCVSAWGHDFRPDYLRLGPLAEALGHPPVLALTATGSPPVRREIVERLRLRDPLVLTHGFDRPNLHLAVVRHTADADKRAAVLDQVTALRADEPDGSGLVYVATRKDTARYADALTARGLRGAAYHGGLPASRRREVHTAFHEDRLDVVVATSAFGMGIDKPDVRFVVHADVPESPDSYYQEIGRAGRDGAPAEATLHYRPEDLGLRAFFASGVPDEADVATVHAALRAAGGAVRLRALAATLDRPVRSVSRLVNLLEQAHLARSTSRGVRAVGTTSSADAARAAVEAAHERERIERSRVEMMRGYAETERCRRQYLLGYFGEELDEPCGRCDTCESGAAYREAEREGAAPDDELPVGAPVRHAEWGDGTVMGAEGDRITVFFESEGYKVLSRDVVEKGHLLEPA